ncbi:MAG TPA: phosphoribosylaminoimidazolesuccinocarboxamide synthase, partial [Burkholderiaceae bacterium]|nr:phosphoribosylaminoimidazolesuccinocarboxamide synthase [Burkholderiaceae bacterium]
SYDKQYLRDWLEQVRVDGKRWNKKAPAPQLPGDVIQATRDRYLDAERRLVGPQG